MVPHIIVCNMSDLWELQSLHCRKCRQHGSDYDIAHSASKKEQEKGLRMIFRQRQSICTHY